LLEKTGGGGGSSELLQATDLEYTFSGGYAKTPYLDDRHAAQSIPQDQSRSPLKYTFLGGWAKNPKLGHTLFWAMAHWLGRKYQVNMPAILQRHSEGNTFRTKRTKLVRPEAFTAKRLRTKTWHNPYTAKEIIAREKHFSYDHLWTGNEDRHGWNDLREEVMLLKGTTCYQCGTVLHPSEVEIDHVTPRGKGSIRSF